ncbi:retroviral-like aspartic protease family protein, partial [Staphylococcus aureus]
MALAVAEEVASGEVVAGTILVNSFPALVLFDSGASHSFMSARFATRIGLEPESLSVRLNILTGNGLVGVDRVYSSCRIVVSGREFSARLIEFLMADYDVVLGMEWLKDQYARIDCHVGRIIFGIPGEEEFSFSRGEVEPSPPVLRMAVAVAVQFPRVVEEFPDVFPEELPGMPPEREIEFTIDLIPRTAPVSERVYRMVPSEFEILYKIIEEL